MAPSQPPTDRTVSRRTALSTFGVAGALAVAGCLGGGDSELEGSIAASGSNTVAPITQIAAEDFEAEFPGVAVAVEPEGTGAGFQEFCRGNSDFQSASRLILEDEIELCGDNDIDYTNYTVGQDGLAVGVHEDNDWCEQITLDELNQIWDFQSDVEQWSDVRSEWPDEDIALHGRDSASGTFDYFTRAINGEVGAVRDDYSATSQTDEIWDAVEDNVNALGWGGLGHLRSLQDQGGTLKTVAVESDQDGEFYQPTEETIETGAYSPLARPLFFYFNHASLAENTDLIASFARFYINGQHEFAREVGFFAASDENKRENLDQLDQVIEDVGGNPDDITVEARRP